MQFKAPLDERDTLPILDELRRVVRVLRESSHAAVERVGVSGAQLFVLRALAQAPVLSLNELAARVRTHQSTVSTVVARLAADGLVKRATSRRDARRVELWATRAGRALLARAPDAAQERLIAGLERLGPRHRARLADGLRRLTAAMGLAAEAPAMFFEDEPRSRGKRSVRRGR
jgi:DNA-binding MarR family transcriptional regulator